MTEDRSAELRRNLAQLEERIKAACDRAARDRAAVTLVAVTKTFPADDVRRLCDLGVLDVGENRDQEASGKHQECADLPLRWHFVGSVQRNKARSVASYSDVVHSVDRERLATVLGRAAADTGRALDVLIQVSLDPQPQAGGRGGVAPADASALADIVAAVEGVRLAGVMAVAPRGADPDHAFARLEVVSGQIVAAHPAAGAISAGMSGDLEAAVRHGATHLRIGTALLGGRSVPVG